MDPLSSKVQVFPIWIIIAEIIFDKTYYFIQVISTYSILM